MGTKVIKNYLIRENKIITCSMILGQPHEGSSYAAQKDLQMAFHRLEHVRSRLSDLEKMKSEHIQLKSQLHRQGDQVERSIG